MRKLITSTLLTLIAATACTVHLPSARVAIPSRYLFSENDTTLWSADDEWWCIFDDERLNALQDMALVANRDLRVAVAQLEAARESLRSARASYLPSLGAAITGQGEYTTPSSLTSEFLIGPSIDWQLSLFGALRNTRAEAEAELLSTQWAMRGVRLSLTHQVAEAYFTLCEYERSLSLAQHSRTLRQESAALIDSLLRYGMTTRLDRDQALSLVYTAEADIEQYTRQREQALLSLSTVVGLTPAEFYKWWEDLVFEPATSDQLPAPIPAGIPSDLLSRRPDIIQAHYELQAAAARVGIARSNRFPSIPLTASGGIFGSDVHELFSKGYWGWNATGNLTQPLFSFGKLRSAERKAIASYNASVASYEQTLLKALAEVESALVAITTLSRQAERQQNYIEANGRIATLTRALYDAGLGNYLDVISTEQTWYESQMTLVEIVAQQQINYATLAMALGRGWQEE